MRTWGLEVRRENPVVGGGGVVSDRRCLGRSVSGGDHLVQFLCGFKRLKF